MLLRKKIFLSLIVVLATVGILFLSQCHQYINVNNHFVATSLIIIFSIFTLIFIWLKNSLLKNIILIIVFMAGFGFIMVPLYNVFCDVTGLNGKIDLSIASAVPDGFDDSRKITVEFTVSHNDKMPWKFKPKHETMVVHPGQLVKTAYFAQNTTKKTMVVQAIPSISPSRVSRHFKKVKCFCFTSQTLGPGESRYLTLHYYLDKKFPKDVTRLTLAYTLFDITKD